MTTLPNKKSLRKAIEMLREPPKAVLSYFSDKKAKNLAVVGKSLSVENKRVYALLYYSCERLERVSFINKNFECCECVPNTPVKWYSAIEAERYNPAVLINVGDFYSYFNVVDRDTSPFTYLRRKIAEKKAKDRVQKHIQNVHERNAQYDSEMKPIDKDFINYARDVYCLGKFSVEDRHTGFCTECNSEFQTDDVLKHEHQHICPHCGRTLTMFSEKKFPRYNSVEYGVHYIDRDINNEIVVRHFLVSKRFEKDGVRSGYYEYERDRFQENIDDYSFYYNVARWDNTANCYVWRDKKPYFGYMCSMRSICYDDEYLYTDNLDKVFSDNIDYSKTLKLLVEDNKIRAEDYISRLDTAYNVTKDFIEKGYPELLYNYCPNELASETPEKKLKGLSYEYQDFIKSFGFCPDWHLDMLKNVGKSVPLAVFMFYYQKAHINNKLKRIKFVCNALITGPLISERLVKAGYLSVWNAMSPKDFENANDIPLKELFKGLTPEYKSFIKQRNKVKLEEIEILQDVCSKGISADDFKNMISQTYKIVPTHSKFPTIKGTLDFIQKCDKYNVSYHKAISYLSNKENDYSCWNDYCSWYLKLFGKPKRNQLLPKSLMTVHDELFVMIKEKEDKEAGKKVEILNSLISRVFKLFSENNLQNYELGNGFVAVLPHNKLDFATEGNNMGICVGGMGYVKRHAMRSKIIFFIRQANSVDTSFCCCEAKIKDGKVYLAQCRMDHNKAPDKKVKAAAENYCNVINKTLQFKKDSLMLKAAA